MHMAKSASSEVAVGNESSNESRKRLITAAIELFSSRGFHAVSVREICEKAQVNISLISYYFTGKDGLLAAVIEEFTKDNVQKIENSLQPFATIGEFENGVKDFLKNMVDFYLRNSSLMKLFLDELEKGHSEAEKVFSQTFFPTWNKFENYIKAGREAGYLKTFTTDDRIIMVQILAPFLDLMRADVCTQKFYSFSLNDEKFCTDLREQIVGSLLISR